MSNEEIFNKAVIKARGNDWNLQYSTLGLQVNVEDKEKAKGLRITTIESVIFSHPFAKAIWGEKIVCTLCGSDFTKIMESTPDMEMGEYETWWECEDCHYSSYSDAGELKRSYAYLWHLSQMVKRERPLDYLAIFL